ncbi:MAG: MFS transporter [Flavobacteriales bacterium TMED191]|nr:MAG: MFS transporter [Flavobacteriales bacterium TMED191]
MIKKLKKNKEIIAWSLYDFANQPFTTLIVTFIFSAFFTESLAENNQVGTSLWSLGISITAIFVALTSPFLGALADSGGYRKIFLIISTYLCIVSTVCLYFFEPNQNFNILGLDFDVAIIALIVFVIANIGFEFGTVFCNSYLSDLANNKNMGKISGYAWGLGFVGGLISLGVSLVFFDPSNVSNIRLINLLVAAWFFLFSIPTFVFLKDVKPNKGLHKYFKQSFDSIISSFRNVREHKKIVRFLIARLFYNDALITIFAFGGIYAAGTLQFSFNEILILGIVLNISACIGSFLFGHLEDKIGVKKMLMITLWTLLFSTLLAFLAPFLTNFNHLITPKTLFWIAGVFIGLMQGPNQAGSRSLMARLTPEDKKNEFFGFYAFSGKATAFLGPLFFGLLTSAFGTQQAGLVIIVVFFLVGILIFKPLLLND